VAKSPTVLLVSEKSHVLATAAPPYTHAVLAVNDESVCVVVVDDGQGVDPSLAKGGLVNLAERAAARNGTFELFPGTPRGTLLRWCVPR